MLRLFLKILNLILVFSGVFYGNRVFAQLDTEFWFAAPEMGETNLQNSTTYDRPIILRFITFDNGATITVTQPANGAFPVQTLNLGANSIGSIDITNWIDKIENKPADQVLNYGLYIKSSSPIMAYYEILSYCNCAPEIFNFKGENALGKEFYTPFQNLYSNWQTNYAPLPFATFNIVATEDATQVTITPTQNIVGHNANQPYTITLNKGQTYCGMATGASGNAHPSGTHIVANKNIGVTIGDDKVAAGTTPCVDPNGDQLVPVNKLSKEYVLMRGHFGEGYEDSDSYYITATQPNTKIYIEGQLWATLNAGQMKAYKGLDNQLDNYSAYLKADKPIYVYQLSGVSCEVTGALLPGVDCISSRQINFSYLSGTGTQTVFIIVKAGGENAFSVSGGGGWTFNGSEFQTVPATGGQWKYLRKTATLPYDATLSIKNNVSPFHFAFLAGQYGDGSRFAYFSDSKFKIDLGPDLTICPNSIALITPGLGFDTYYWSNGLSSDEINVTNPGKYWVKVTENGCEATDTVQIMQREPLTIQTFQQNISCANGSDGAIVIDEVLNGFAPFVYAVNGGAFQSEPTFNGLPQGTYVLSVKDANGCIAEKIITLTASLKTLRFFTTFKKSYNCPDCTNGKIAASGIGGVAPYQYSLNGVNYQTSGVFNNLSPGTYVLYLKDTNGCIITRTVVLD